MQRAIASFSTDDIGDPIALLSCGHPQHVRHKPPWEERPWVVTPEGRARMLGQTLDCVRCDRLEWPAGFAAYKHTAVFDHDSVPAGLRRDHSTKAGVWARIIVQAGMVRYRVPQLAVDVELRPGVDGIVIPEIEHSVEPSSDARFYVEFHRATPAPASAR